MDLAASDKGGNVAGTKDGEKVVTANGVTIIGAGEIAAQMAPAASDAYARNVLAVLNAVIIDGAVVVDVEDDVLGAILIAAKETSA